MWSQCVPLRQFIASSWPVRYIQISKEDVCGNVFLNGMQLQNGLLAF